MIISRSIVWSIFFGNVTVWRFHVNRWCSGSRSEEHTSELQSRLHLVCRLLLEKKNICAHGVFLRNHVEASCLADYLWYVSCLSGLLCDPRTCQQPVLADNCSIRLRDHAQALA